MKLGREFLVRGYFYTDYHWTILELKHEDTPYFDSCILIIIEPYWNWNVVKTLRFSKESFIIIEPYWNWNVLPPNATLEQKIIIIEPYWNWNLLLFCFSASIASLSLNHTGIETQFLRRVYIHIGNYHWTILELKQGGGFYWCRFLPYYHWTILELKRCIQVQS